MRLLSKYWKALLALILAGAAAFLFVNVYQTEKRAYEYDKEVLTSTITHLQQNIATNTPYKDVQEEITAEREKLAASRLNLYNHLPVDVKQEDQIMYVLYLESVFGTEINFEFSEPTDIIELQDGSILKSVDLIVNYRSTYQGFQDMINYLAQDTRVVSIDKSNIKYYPKQDLAIGFVKIKLYLLDTTNSVDPEIRKYVKPEIINEPETGVENIFENKYHQPTKEVPQQKPYPTRDDLKDGGGSDLDSMVWVTHFDRKYHRHDGCVRFEQSYHDGGQPVKMSLADIKMNGYTACEDCFRD